MHDDPITTARSIEDGIAGTIDAAIATEDTPAYVQFNRVADSVAHASAHDLGYGVGTVAGNVGLVIAPGAVAAKVSAVRRASTIETALAAKSPPKIIWVDENTGLKGVAKNYNDSAMGRALQCPHETRAGTCPRTYNAERHNAI